MKAIPPSQAPAPARRKKRNRKIAATPPRRRRPYGHPRARIFSQLDCIDFLRCSLVCKQWYRDSAELGEGWKNEYMEAYYQLGLGIERKTHPPSSTCSIRGAVGARNSLVLPHLLSPKTDIRSPIC